MYEEVKSALKAAIPAPLLAQLLDHHRELKRALLTRDWEKCLVRSGKLAETVMKLIHFLRTGKIVKAISVDKEIQEAEKDATIPREVRITIPRHVRVLYEHRSNRGGTHTSFDPNEMDSGTAASVADWVIAELLRLYGQVSPDEAMHLVEGLIRRQVPYVEEIDGDLVPLAPATTVRQDVGLVLYKRHPTRVAQADLRKWLAGATPNAIAVTIHRMKKDREIHANQDGIVLTSRGLAAVEADIGDAT
jgi:hypothetical protein